MARIFSQEELKQIGKPQTCGKTDSQVRGLEHLLRTGVCGDELGKSLEESMYDFPEEIVLDYLQTPLAARGSFIEYAKQRALSGDIKAYEPFLTKTPTEEEFMQCIDAEFHGSLDEYQKFGVAYMLAAKHLLLGDECGLGKTVELCSALSRLKKRGRLQGFVVCVESDAAEQWQREIVRFSGLNAVVIDSCNATLRKLFNGDLFTEEELANIDGIIIKHSLLAQKYAVTYLEKLHELFDFNVCVLDESSVVKSMKTNSFVNAQALVHDVEYVFLLNATAFELVIEDLYAQFVLLSPDIFKNKTWVEDRFCKIRLEKVWVKGGKQKTKRVIVSYVNTDLFRSRVKYFYLARTRQELGFVRNNVCSCELFEKTKEMNHGIKTCGGRWAEVLNCPSLCDWNSAYLTPDIAPLRDKRTFNLPIDAEHMPKLRGLYDLIERKWQAGVRHIVIYCYHTETQDIICSDLAKRFGHLGVAPAILSGQTRAQDRQELVDAFNKGEVNVLITNICKSLNLSIGELCIFYSVVTNPSRLLQIASRINRDTSAKVREYVVMAYHGEELANILNAYKRSENKKKLLGDYADASTDILAVCKAEAMK